MIARISLATGASVLILLCLVRHGCGRRTHHTRQRARGCLCDELQPAQKTVAQFEALTALLLTSNGPAAGWQPASFTLKGSSGSPRENLARATVMRDNLGDEHREPLSQMSWSLSNERSAVHTPPTFSARTPSVRCCLPDTEPLSTIVEADTDSNEQRLIFVGGKGGVGKTTTSSALAVRLADNGMNTLIVSTDPAHSLSDALDMDVSGGSPKLIPDCPNLFAMEVETGEAIDRFRAAVGGFRASDLGIGGPAEEVLSKLGLDEFADILDNTPPGLDELLALAETLAVVREGASIDDGQKNEDLGRRRFARIVFDTAPTGHTLRLLAFPEFLDKLISKVIALKARVGGAISLLSGLVGGIDVSAKLDRAVARLERWQSRVSELQRLLTDPDVTDFVIVGIPSRLSVAESARLLSSLAEQGVPVNHLVVNQIVRDNVRENYAANLAAEQQRALQKVDGGTSPLCSLKLSRVPFMQVELRGEDALMVYSSKAYGDAGGYGDAWRDLFEDKKDRFVLVGGKGGVGKTTSSAALAVEFAERGFNTLIVSTDPAHSLGDALMQDLSSGKVVRIPGLLSASLYAIEVKVDEAVADFKRLVSSLSDGAAGEGGDVLGLADFADVFDAVPPGVDELIALAKIVALARADSYGIHFDRVVVDTAPTGHTLRLLTFPDFLDRFIERFLILRKRFQSASSLVSGATNLIGNLLSQSGSGVGTGGMGMAGNTIDVGSPAGTDGTQDEPRAMVRLAEFQAQMKDLDSLLKDSTTSEFVIVSIPTYLSLTESERLLAALREQGISVRRGVVNRLVPADSQRSYIQQMAQQQQECLAEMEDLASRACVSVTQVPLMEVELRGIDGLTAMGYALFETPVAAAKR